MPERIDLDSQLAPARQAIDANWSKRKKALVGAGAGAVVVIALGAGVWFFLDSRLPALPKTADEAIAVLQSAKFEKLPPQRQRQYAAEARRLFGEMPEDERRELRASEETRQALRAMFEQTRDEMVLRFARADSFQEVIEEMGFGGRGFGGRPRGEGGRGDRQGGEGGGRPGRGEGGEGRRDPDARQARMRERVSQFLREGNAQMGALMGEMRKRMQAEGGGNRGGGGGGGRRS